MIEKIIAKYKSLDTLEKKTFWMIGPAIILTGFISVFTLPGYTDHLYAIGSIVAYTIFPIVTMIFCFYSKDYRHCYPIMCIGTSAILIPMLFLLNGGFFSGMPVICAASTVISVFCSSKRWRYTSFILSLLGNGAAFIAAENFGLTYNVLNETWIKGDIIFAYFMVSGILFILLEMLLTETRNYAVDSQILSRYMDDPVRKRLTLQQTDNDVLNNEDIVRRRITVLFADISNFTATTEKMDPETSAQYVNTFLSIADEKIHANKGIVDKYIGDCVMAYWVDENKDGTGIIDAIKAILDTRAELNRYAQDIYDRFHVELDFTAGIEYGDAVLGSMGSPRRKDFTAIGDTVNTASRIQSIASRGELLVSETVFPLIRDKVVMEISGKPHFLKGKTNPVQLYKVNSIRDNADDAVNIDKLAKKEVTYQLHVCGCRGSHPVSGMRYAQFGGETSCYLLMKDDYALLIDCGTGLDVAEEIMTNCKHVDIVLTHLHYDHILGLLDTSVFPKGATVSLYGAFSRWGGFEAIDRYMDNPYWPVELPKMQRFDKEVEKPFTLNNEIVVTFYPANHPGNACVLSLNVKGKQVCFFTDMENADHLDESIAKDAYLLFYDGMFDDSNPHPGWGHGTWQSATAYAEKENVRKLVITHHDPELGDRDLRHIEKMARSKFENTVFARTGDKYDI